MLQYSKCLCTDGSPPFTLHRKTPWRLSPPQKRRQRKRLRLIDRVVATVERSLVRNGWSDGIGSLRRWRAEMPTEGEMLPRDKYTMFDRKEKMYRKGVHSKFFRTISLRPIFWSTGYGFEGGKRRWIGKCKGEEDGIRDSALKDPSGSDLPLDKEANGFLVQNYQSGRGSARE